MKDSKAKCNKWGMPALVFCGCVRNYSTLVGIKQPTFIISVSVVRMVGPLLRVSRGCNQGEGLAAFSSRGSTGLQFAFKLTWLLIEFISLHCIIENSVFLLAVGCETILNS